MQVTPSRKTANSTAANRLPLTPLTPLGPRFRPRLLQLRTHAQQPLALRLPIRTERAHEHVLELVADRVDGPDELPARAVDGPEAGAVPDFEQLVCDGEVVREVRGVRLLVRGDGPEDPGIGSVGRQHDIAKRPSRWS